MNLLTGGLSILINAVNLIQGNYYAAGTGLLFGFTYLYVAFMDLFDLNPIPYAWFSTFVAVNAFIFGTVEGFLGSEALGISADLRWAAIWYLWAILWGSAFVETILGKKLGKFVPCLQIFEGVVTAWVPGLLMLLKLW
jgi:acid-activated urea channel